MANVGSGLVVLIRSGKGTNNIGNTNHLDGIDSISVDAINSITKMASNEKVHILKINFLEIRILEIHCLRSRLCKQGQWSEVIQLSLIDLNCELPTAHPFPAAHIYATYMLHTYTHIYTCYICYNPVVAY